MNIWIWIGIVIYLTIGFLIFIMSEEQQKRLGISCTILARTHLPYYWIIIGWLPFLLGFWLYFNIGSLLAYKHNKRVIESKD